MSKIDELMSMIEDGEAVIAALREEIKHAKEQGAKELAELIIDKYYPGSGSLMIGLNFGGSHRNEMRKMWWNNFGSDIFRNWNKSGLSKGVFDLPLPTMWLQVRHSNKRPTKK